MTFRDDPQYRAERRDLVRRLHPDHGGDETEFVASLNRLDQKYHATTEHNTVLVVTTTRRGTLRRWTIRIGRRLNPQRKNYFKL